MLVLRELRPTDRPALERLIRSTNAFREDEVEVALELIDASPDPAKGYLLVVAADVDAAQGRDEPVGYACWGLTPLTDGAYDLYWIVVDHAQQGRGIGRKLLEHVRTDVRARHGRLVIIETSGKPDYAYQRAFYERCGGTLLARYPDFYRLGDDKLVYLVRP